MVALRLPTIWCPHIYRSISCRVLPIFLLQYVSQDTGERPPSTSIHPKSSKHGQLWPRCVITKSRLDAGRPHLCFPRYRRTSTVHIYPASSSYRCLYNLLPQHFCNNIFLFRFFPHKKVWSIENFDLDCPRYTFITKPRLTFSYLQIKQYLQIKS